MKKVLIVDDNVALTRLVKINLEATKTCQVMAAHSGGEGIEMARSFGPDIIFLDLIMPDMGGEQAAELLKKDPSLSDIPVVFLSGGAAFQEADGAKSPLDGQKFLAKPMFCEQMIEYINLYAK